jgi:tetratricopeptide (TPR) repeat protein
MDLWMGTLLELFTILDGFEQGLPEQFAINPDPALNLARRALQGQAPAQDALEAIESQIRLVRPLMRAQRFDVIAAVHSESGWSEYKIFQMAGDLHRHAALLSLSIERIDAARQHLLCAITCQPEDPNLAFFLVDAYAQEGRFVDACDLLERTYDTFAPGRPEKILGLYRLAVDALKAGKVTDARQLYEVIAKEPDAGVFVELCRRQLSTIEDTESRAPEIQLLNQWYGEAMASHQAGKPADATARLYDVLAWEPTHETCWFFVGYIKAAEGVHADADGVVRVPVSIDEKRREQLIQAIQALTMAVQFNERPQVVYESRRLLTSCYLELGEPSDAVESAITMTRMDPEDATAWANLSMAHLANVAFTDAGDAALQALKLDEHNPVALHTLVTLQQMVDQQ